MSVQLKVGKSYRFRTDGVDWVGEVRTLNFPRGYAGVNEDGQHPIWVTTRNGFERFLSQDEIIEAEEA